MPELPEVETVVRTLAPLVVGRTISGAAVHDPLLCAPLAPEEVARGIHGGRISGLVRRGKYMVLSLEGCPTLQAIIHLRMTGQLLYWTGDVLPDRCRLELILDDGGRLVLRDVRRLGRLDLEPPHGLLGLGPDPYEEGFDDHLVRSLRRRRVAVKAALLDQGVAAGTGNIYADEALFLAGIDPRRPAGDLREDEVRGLARALREVFDRSLSAGGTTIDTYVDGRGAKGEFAESLAVYGRTGQPCPRCKEQVQRTVIAGRGTHWCESCQR